MATREADPRPVLPIFDGVGLGYGEAVAFVWRPGFGVVEADVRQTDIVGRPWALSPGEEGAEA